MPVRYALSIGSIRSICSIRSNALLFPLAIAALVVTPAIAAAQAAQAEDPAHAELRALRDSMVDAVAKRDIPRLLSHLHSNVVVTWQNAEISRGHDGVRAYLDRMLNGDARIVDQFTTTPTVDELTILYGGDAGIAFGSSSDHFVLRNGPTFDLASRWTATLVKDEGAWKVAAFHASTNLFDNPVTAAARRYLIWTGIGALVAGLVIGAIVMRLMRGTRA